MVYILIFELLCRYNTGSLGEALYSAETVLTNSSNVERQRAKPKGEHFDITHPDACVNL